MLAPQWFTLLLYLAIVLLAGHRYVVSKQFADRLSLHLFCLCSLGLLLLWLLRAGLIAGLELHMVGLTTVTLVLGGHATMLAATIALLGLAQLDYISWQAFGSLGLFQVAVPVGWTLLVQWLIWRYLPHHLFVYLFVGAFGCGALSQLWLMLGWGSWMGVTGQVSWMQIKNAYWMGTPMLLFPEGLLNGMAITLLAVYKPHWLVIYDDREYVLKR